MKKIYSLLILLFMLTLKQSSAQNSCSTPQLYSSPITSAACITGYTNTDTLNNYGCLPIIDNAQWLYFRVCSGGNFDFNLTGNTSSDDVNFIVWGPLTTASQCPLTASDIVACSAVTANFESFTISGTTVGEYYKIMINNHTGTAVGWYLNQVGGTGVACDSIVTCGPGPTQEICQVTTDLALNKNIIIWEKDTTYTEPYFIEKETTTMGVFATIAIIANNDTSAYVDTISNPMIQAFQYRIGTTDTCGLGVMTYGSPHQTIHLLTSTSSSTGYPQLNWSNYYGFPYYTYYIFRGSSPATLTLYDSISASFNSYTDVAAVPGMNYYSVSVLPDAPCQPSRAMNMYSFSNVSPVMFTGINEYEFNQLTVGPNPANEILNFTLGNVSADIKVDIIDIAGRIIFSRSFENVNQDAISLAEISNGSYVVRFTSENKTTHRNVIIAR